MCCWLRSYVVVSVYLRFILLYGSTKWRPMKGITCLWVHSSIKSVNVFSHCSNAPATKLHIEFRSSLQGGKIKSISSRFRLCTGMLVSGIIFSLDLAFYSSWKCFISERHINSYQYIIKMLTFFRNFK